MRGANGSRMEKRFTLETLLPLSNVTLYIVGGIEETIEGEDKYGQTADSIECLKGSKLGVIRCQVTKDFFFDKGLRKRMTSSMAIAML